MALVSCIQDQASYYRKLTNELKSEATIESELTHINQERDRLAQLIETKQQEINSLEKNS
jgi:predicted  nucleic acid-binding Zn-ribbon protein